LIQSIEEHQKIPTGEDAVIPVRELKMRCMVCNLATERRQKRKERTLGYRGSRRKWAPACEKVSCCAKVAWKKWNLLKNVQTQRKCGPWKELAIACRNVPHHAKVAWRNRNIARKKRTSASVVQEIQRGRVFGRKTTKSIGGRRRRHQSQLEIMGNGNKICRKTMGLEFGKRAFGISSGI
jgi:hypothetical protein